MTSPANFALNGLEVAAFCGGGLAFAYFVQGNRWAGGGRSRLMGNEPSRRISRLAIAFWTAGIAIALAVAAVALLVALAG